jgi:signal transduction histidine kinase
MDLPVRARPKRRLGLAERSVSAEREFSVAILPPTLRQRRSALGVVAVLIIAFGTLAPLAADPLPRIDSFVPTVEAMILLTDLLTSILLFGQFSIVRSSALLVLASGYLFSALIVIPHTLTYPGAMAPKGLLGAGVQSSPLLYVVWHFGFPAAVVAYACLKDGQRARDAIGPSGFAAIVQSVMIVIVLVCALTLAVTIGEPLFPPLLLDGVRFSPWAHYTSGIDLLLTVLALVLLWIRRRSIVDLWLLVTVVALMAELAIVTFIIPGRFTLGFYLARLYSVIASMIVLVVLLSEATRLYARLAGANAALQRERQSKLVNMEAAVAAIAHQQKQPLMGIATKGAAAVRFLEREPPDVAKVKGMLGDMVKATFRANKALESIRALFKGSDQDQHSVNVNELAREALLLLRMELENHGIVVRTQLTSGLSRVTGHKGQLREVILNLVQNSIDALAPMTEGSRVLRVETERSGDEAVAISVEDTGPGISLERMTHIFEPFVTTRAPGRGLGLAICKMIVERHGGTLSVSLGANGGARFQTVLPIKATALSAPDEPEPSPNNPRA